MKHQIIAVMQDGKRFESAVEEVADEKWETGKDTMYDAMEQINDIGKFRLDVKGDTEFGTGTMISRFGEIRYLFAKDVEE